MLKSTDLPQTEIEYPTSDGEPMAETDAHRIQMTDALIYPLKEYFRDTPDVYVSGNLLIYYEEGNPCASVAPDVFVVFGVPDEKRSSYKIWEEKQVPSVVFELTSESTRQKDLRLFDPQMKRYLLMPDEESAARRVAELRVREAEQRAAEAEAEIARLQALLDQLKKD